MTRPAEASIAVIPSNTPPVVFVSTMDGDPWGGSEELWYEAALDLRKRGVAVGAFIQKWPSPHPKVQTLLNAGVDIIFRTKKASLLQRVEGKLASRKCSHFIPVLEAWLKKKRPALIIISEQFGLPSSELTGMLRANGWRYIVVSHCNNDQWWPKDFDAEQYRHGVEAAEAMYFVSQGNLKLARAQAGFSMDNVGILRNPYSVPYDKASTWPATAATEHLRMACVGRLAPSSKGQDILIDVLSAPKWRERNWTLSFYGQGEWKGVLERQVRHADLSDRIIFAGHRSISEVWADNHILVQPSRAEGLPITIVEAMMSGRPVMTTDVAGNAELLQDGVSGFIADAPVAKLVDQSLERVWSSRAQLEQMGQAARSAVQAVIPPEPARIFADIILDKLTLPARV